jgi:zinc protease
MRTRWLVSCALSLALASIPAMSRAAPVATQRHTCPNGLEVVVSEMHATPLVTIEVAVHAGAMIEDDKYNGVSHLYEHMFFKGNAVQPDQVAYMMRQRELGAESNGTTGDERVNYYFITTSDHFPDQMAFMRDAIATPRFDPKELERERVVVTGEMDRGESQPTFAFSHAIEQKLFFKYPTRKWAIGKRASVLAATVDMMRTIQQRYYVPNNSVLVVTGDVKADAVFALADTLYAGWARAADPFTRFPVPDNPPLPRTEIVLLAQPVENFTGGFVWHGPSTLGPAAADTYAANVLTVMTNEAGSRFQKTLVDSGLCVSASLWFYRQRTTSELGVDFEALPDKIDACTSALVAELPKLREAGYFADEELANAVHRIAVYRALERETTSGRAHALTAAWASASLEIDARYEDAVAAVNRQGLAGLLDRWVLGKPFVFGGMASPKQLAAGLTEARLAKLVNAPPPVAKAQGGK